MLICFLQLIKASSIIKNFGNISLPISRNQTFDLLEFFQGDSLKFSISCEKGRIDSNIIQSYEESKRSSYGFNPGLINVKLNKTQMPTIWTDSKGLSFVYHNSIIFCVSTNEFTGSSIVVAFYDMKQVSKNLIIDGLSLVNKGDSSLIYIVVLMKNIQSSIENLVQYNYLYLMKLDPWLPKLDFVKDLEINELKHVNDLKFGLNLKTFYIGLSGENGTIVFIIDFNNILNPKVIQDITELVSVPSDKPLKLQINSFVTVGDEDNIEMMMLDVNSNLVRFVLIDNKFEEMWTLPLEIYGSIFSIYPYSYKRVFFNLYMISTSKGLLIVDVDKKEEVSFFTIPSFESFSFIGVFSNFNIFYLLHTDEKGESAYLTAISSNYMKSTLYDFKVTNDVILVSSPWTFVEGPFSIYLVSIGIDGFIHVMEPKIFEPKIMLYPNETFAKCVIQAVSRKDDTILNNPINISSYDDFYKPQILKQANSTSNIIEQNLVINENHTNYTLMTDMVSGWNINCLISSFNEADDSFTIKSRNMDKFSLNKSYEVQQLKNFYVINSYLVLVYDDNVKIFLINSQSNRTFYISNVDQVIISSFSNGKTLIAFVLLMQRIYTINYCIIQNIIKDDCPYNSFFYSKSKILATAFDSYFVITDDNINVFKTNDFETYYSYHTEKSNGTIFQISMTLSIKVDNSILLYIGYKDRITVMNVNQFIQIDKIPYTYENDLIKGYTYFLVNDTFIYVLTKKNLLIFTSLFENLETIMSIPLKKILALDDFLLGINDNQIFLINSTEKFISEAVFLVHEFQNLKFIGFTYDINENALILTSDSKSVDIYNVYCPSRQNKCYKGIPIQINYKNNSTSQEYVFNLQAVVNCYGIHNSSVTLYHNMKASTFGFDIRSKQTHIENSISYTNEKIYDLNDLFSGYNMQPEISINNKIVEYNDPSPVNIVPSLVLLNTINTNLNVSDISLIKHKETALLMDGSGNLFYIANFFSDSKVSKYDIFSNLMISCPIIRYYSSIKTVNFTGIFVLGCYRNFTEYIEKYKLALVIFDEETNSLINYTFIDVNYPIDTIKIIDGTSFEFIIAVIEKVNKEKFVTNNHAEIFRVNWTNFTIVYSYVQNLNFYTLKLDKLLIQSISGKFSFNEEIILYIIDYYTGLVIFKWNSITKGFDLDTRFYIQKPVVALGTCGNLILVACEDTTVYVYRYSNKNYVKIYEFHPYMRSSYPYLAMKGFIECNSYYHPQLILLPIKTSDSYSIRIFDYFSDESSAVLRDIKISDEAPYNDYMVKGVFYNESVFLTFDASKGTIFVYSIRQPSLIFPKYTKSDYKKVLKDLGESKFKYVISVKNDNRILYDHERTLERKGVSQSTVGSTDDIELWKIFMIVIAVFIIISCSGLIVYQLIWKKCFSEKKEKYEFLEIYKIN